MKQKITLISILVSLLLFSCSVAPQKDGGNTSRDSGSDSLGSEHALLDSDALL